MEENYNEDPVYFCPKCLSLRIKIFSPTMDYCDDCGSTEIEQTDIFTWIELYRNRYGRNFV